MDPGQPAVASHVAGEGGGGMSAVSEAVNAALTAPIKLDIGCGKNKRAGFIGVDIYDFEGVDIVADVRKSTWRATKVPGELKPRMVEIQFSEDGDSETNLFWGFASDSVDEAHASHFLEHLTNFGDKWERVNFFNELYRIMKVGAQCMLIFPHWSSNRFYGDPTHKEPFSEMGFYYLNRVWRLDQGNAPHADSTVNPNGYSCDFDATWGYTWDTKRFEGRNDEYIRYALTNYKDVIHDIQATLTKKAPA